MTRSVTTFYWLSEDLSKIKQYVNMKGTAPFSSRPLFRAPILLVQLASTSFWASLAGCCNQAEGTSRRFAKILWNHLQTK